VAECSHLDSIQEAPPLSNGCEECLEKGYRWLHLRRCATCGHVGCCDGSPNKHASKHAKDSAHPIVQSFEPDEEWFWCYVDEAGFEIPDAPSYSYPARRRSSSMRRLRR
jgi:uncharacterized UBP type Zn finger protein